MAFPSKQYFNDVADLMALYSAGYIQLNYPINFYELITCFTCEMSISKVISNYSCQLSLM